MIFTLENLSFVLSLVIKIWNIWSEPPSKPAFQVNINEEWVIFITDNSMGGSGKLGRWNSIENSSSP